jgi:hypothetical protein
LIDLSVMGTQVVALQPLHPDQSVHVLITAGTFQTQSWAVVEWVHAEPNRGTIQYRAGLHFLEPETDVLETLCRQSKREIVGSVSST